MPKSKYTTLIIVLLIILVLAVLGFYFFIKNNTDKDGMTNDVKTPEQLRDEIRNYQPQETLKRDPALLKQELINYKEPKSEETGPSRQEMLDELRNIKPQ